MRQQNNLKLENNNHILYICSGAAFVLIATLFVLNFLHVFTVNSANAETTASKSTDMAVTLQPTLEIWTTDTDDTSIAALNIPADPDAAVYTGTVRAHVSTNNETGYTLTMSSSAASAAMVSEETTETIAPLGGTDLSTDSWKANKNLNNQWAFKIGTTDLYNPVVGSGATASELNSTDGAANDSKTDVTFGAKVDESLPAGTYTNTVIFSAVANPAAPTVPTALEDGQNMQDVDATTCAGTADGDTLYTLTDTRNSQEYKVRKLSDGNCWMMENLYLPHTYQTEMNSETTNLPEGVTATLPNASSSAFTNSDGVKEMNDGGKSTGSYYNWCVATGETGGCRGTDKAATGDICPKNWRLPTGSANGTAADASEQAWLVALGKTTFDSKFYASSPVYPGFYDGSGLRNSGSLANWWSSTQDSATVAYGLYAGSSGGLATGNGNKYGGLSVRCLLPGA